MMGDGVVNNGYIIDALRFSADEARSIAGGLQKLYDSGDQGVSLLADLQESGGKYLLADNNVLGDYGLDSRNLRVIKVASIVRVEKRKVILPEPGKYGGIFCVEQYVCSSPRP
jgi:hypothetical protein